MVLAFVCHNLKLQVFSQFLGIFSVLVFVKVHPLLSLRLRLFNIFIRLLCHKRQPSSWPVLKKLVILSMQADQQIILAIDMKSNQCRLVVNRNISSYAENAVSGVKYLNLMVNVKLLVLKNQIYTKHYKKALKNL